MCLSPKTKPFPCLQIQVRYLGVVYTMEREVIPRPCKVCDWLLNSYWSYRDRFGLHQGKHVEVITEFQVPESHIFRPMLSTDMAQHFLRWARQMRCYKVCRPKTNTILKPTLCTTCIHLKALGAFKCMHVVHSVGFRIVLVLGRHTLLEVVL